MDWLEFTVKIETSIVQNDLRRALAQLKNGSLTQEQYDVICARGENEIEKIKIQFS